MGIDAGQFRMWVVRAPLQVVKAWDGNAEELLMLTAAQESHLGRWIHQVNGPALGPFQMEPPTHEDIWDNYLYYLRDKVPFVRQDPEVMIYDLSYAAIMCRMHYRRVAAPLPAATDIEGLAAYWKQYYNTPLGNGTVEEAIANYKTYVQKA